MKTTVNFSLLKLGLGCVGLTALAGCAPMIPEPIYPQAGPAPVYTAPGVAMPQPAPAPRPPIQQQPRQVIVPPQVHPVEEPRQAPPRPSIYSAPSSSSRSRVESAPRRTEKPRVSTPSASTTRPSDKPAVQFIPDPSPSTPTTPSASVNKPSPSTAQTRPFWDEGKVEVEVMDMKKEVKPDTGNTSVTISPLERTVSSTTTQTTTTTNVATSTPVPPLSGSSNPAVTVLSKQANNELAAGMVGRAAATLERALRIAPDDAGLWLRLAEANEQQGNKRQASSMAQKALSLAPDNESIRQRAQRLL